MNTTYAYLCTVSPSVSNNLREDSDLLPLPRWIERPVANGRYEKSHHNIIKHSIQQCEECGCLEVSAWYLLRWLCRSITLSMSCWWGWRGLLDDAHWCQGCSDTDVDWRLKCSDFRTMKMLGYIILCGCYWTTWWYGCLPWHRGIEHSNMMLSHFCVRVLASIIIERNCFSRPAGLRPTWRNWCSKVIRCGPEAH